MKIATAVGRIRLLFMMVIIIITTIMEDNIFCVNRRNYTNVKTKENVIVEYLYFRNIVDAMFSRLTAEGNQISICGSEFNQFISWSKASDILTCSFCLYYLNETYKRDDIVH